MAKAIKYSAEQCKNDKNFVVIDSFSFRNSEQWKTATKSDYFGYNVKQRLGAGGQGSVFLGLLNDVTVAVKKMNVENFAKENAEREIDALTKLQNSNRIVKLLGYSPKIDFWYIALERCRTSLQLYCTRSEISSDITMPREENVLLQLTEGLKFIHENGWIHRDIKPANILISCDKKKTRLKFADFGLSTTSKLVSQSLAPLRVQQAAGSEQQFYEAVVEANLSILKKPSELSSVTGSSSSELPLGTEQSACTSKFTPELRKADSPVLKEEDLPYSINRIVKTGEPSKIVATEISSKSLWPQGTKQTVGGSSSSNTSVATEKSESLWPQGTKQTVGGSSSSNTSEHSNSENRSEISNKSSESTKTPSSSDEAVTCWDTQGGTTGWMAPELFVKNEQQPKVGTQSDVFALGCVFFFYLTKGNHPFGCMQSGIAQVQNCIHEDFKINLACLNNDHFAFKCIEGMIQHKREERTTLDGVLKILNIYKTSTKHLSKATLPKRTAESNQQQLLMEPAAKKQKL